MREETSPKVRQAYALANRYAWKLKYTDSTDLVHDCYLMWWDKNKRNLFEEPNGVICKVIKLSFLSYLKKDNYTYNKTSYGKRAYESFDSESLHTYNTITPEDHLIGKELLTSYNDLINKCQDSRAVFTGNVDSLRLILKRRLEGFNNKEIADELGVSKSLITYYLDQTNFKLLKPK